MAVCYYGWEWFTAALPDQPYGDVARTLREIKARGFNCIRPEVGLGLLFDWKGKPRDQIEFACWIQGASENVGRGGGTHDVLSRVLQLF